jgi:dihydrodipicolinate synthase/N-acetylneuraminate lyase
MEAYGYFAVLMVVILIFSVTLYAHFDNKKRRKEMIQKLSEHPNVTLIQDYSQTMDRMRSLFVSFGDKYANTASRKTIIDIFCEALLKRQLRDEKGIDTGDSICW